MQDSSTYWRLLYATNAKKAAEILAIESGDDDAHNCNDGSDSGGIDNQRTAAAIYTIVIMVATEMGFTKKERRRR